MVKAVKGVKAKETALPDRFRRAHEPQRCGHAEEVGQEVERRARKVGILDMAEELRQLLR